jgi:MarR family transcriptional regulator for hemolysin
MTNFSLERDFGFLINDVARLLRTYADQKARQFGMTRAQWAVLFRIERNEGVKQSEIADILDIQPITLTRLIDRLCDNGLIERRGDPNDRRAKRLFLTPAARPVLEKFNVLTRDMMADVLAGIDKQALTQLVKHLAGIKDNLRDAIATRARGTTDTQINSEERHYG